MRTIQKAHAIIAAAPGEALREVFGIVVLAGLIFAGFLLPALV